MALAIVSELHGALAFSSGLKRESGENPELPRSGKQERTLQDGTGRRAGKPKQVGSLQSPKTCHEDRARVARTSHTSEGKVRWPYPAPLQDTCRLTVLTEATDTPHGDGASDTL
jgi:hypothetical protein